MLLENAGTGKEKYTYVASPCRNSDVHPGEMSATANIVMINSTVF
jgi:hypothetical protein